MLHCVPHGALTVIGLQMAFLDTFRLIMLVILLLLALVFCHVLGKTALAKPFLLAVLGENVGVASAARTRWHADLRPA